MPCLYNLVGIMIVERSRNALLSEHNFLNHTSPKYVLGIVIKSQKNTLILRQLK